jgi:hypothetical protein
MNLLLGIALGIELLEVRPQIFGCLLVLDAGKYHFGARNLRFRILDVLLESRFVPYNPGILIGIGITVTWHTTGVAALKAVEFGSYSIHRTRTDLMTSRTLFEYRRALPDVLRQRRVCL